MSSITEIAKSMYAAYSEQAGGKTFDGKPLPAYEELGADRHSCWEAAAQAAIQAIAP